MKYKVLIIANPVAGGHNIKKYIHRIIENLNSLNFDTHIEYTSIENSATNIIKDYKEEYDVLLVCGGDGTLNQAIQGIYETNKKVQVAYIPTGTSNDFARSLNISFDKLHISKNINEYILKQIDVGLINNKIFNYVVAFGIFSKSSYRTNRKIKQKFGKLAYVFSGIKEILTYKTYKLSIQTKSHFIEDEFIYGSISNSKYIGSFNVLKNKKISFDDGKFEAIFVKKTKNFFHTISLILKVIRGDFSNEYIYYFQTSDLTIKCNNAIKLAIDGEFGGAKKEIKIHVQNKYIEYLLPLKDNKTKITKNTTQIR